MVGASMILLSLDAGKTAEDLARNTVHISVADDPVFEERFIENLFFPEQKKR
jgi:uncharacterized 2Fe-2S/4Fe-4S cluster protein (DUF4445 family)